MNVDLPVIVNGFLSDQFFFEILRLSRNTGEIISPQLPAVCHSDSKRGGHNIADLAAVEFQPLALLHDPFLNVGRVFNETFVFKLLNEGFEDGDLLLWR